MIENEFKVMLNEEQYKKVRAMFAWDKIISQTNYYYDNEDLELAERHITCRVRKIGGECFLQMKLPNGAAYSRVELEQKLGGEVPASLSADILNGRAGVTAGKPLPEARLLGSLTTERCVRRIGCEIDLDKSSYLGKTDYELEIEFTDEEAARTLLRSIAEQAGISPDGDVCQGKVHRFLAEYLAAHPHDRGLPE